MLFKHDSLKTPRGLAVQRRASCYEAHYCEWEHRDGSTHTHTQRLHTVPVIHTNISVLIVKEIYWKSDFIALTSVNKRNVAGIIVNCDTLRAVGAKSAAQASFLLHY